MSWRHQSLTCKNNSYYKVTIYSLPPLDGLRYVFDMLGNLDYQAQGPDLCDHLNVQQAFSNKVAKNNNLVGISLQGLKEALYILVIQEDGPIIGIRESLLPLILHLDHYLRFQGIINCCIKW